MDTYRGAVSRILLALVIVAGLCVVIFQSPFLVKQLGDVLLIVPEALGMIRRVSPGEVLQLELRSMPRSAIDFRTAGMYMVYASDISLLAELGQSEEAPSGFMSLSSKANGTRIPITTVARSLMPYDTPHADGRPVLKFMITEPGIYITDLLARPVCYLDTCEMTIVPDYTTGKEIVIWPIYALQLSLFASPLLAVFIRRKYRRALRDEMRRQAEAPRQQVAEDFWQREVKQTRSQRKGETETKK